MKFVFNISARTIYHQEWGRGGRQPWLCTLEREITSNCWGRINLPMNWILVCDTYVFIEELTLKPQMKHGNNQKAADSAYLRFAFIVLRTDSLRTPESAGGMEPLGASSPRKPKLHFIRDRVLYLHFACSAVEIELELRRWLEDRWHWVEKKVADGRAWEGQTWSTCIMDLSGRVIVCCWYTLTLQ